MQMKSRRRLDFLWQKWKGLHLQIESLNPDLEQDAVCVRVKPEIGGSRCQSLLPAGRK